MPQQFDLVVIGSGPAGYVGAIRAAQLGMSVAVVEKDKTFGGTCLNVGCIPSKALLESSELYHAAQHELNMHGVQASGLSLNLDVMVQRKSKIVDELTKGIAFLFRKNKITSLPGKGSLVSPQEVKITAMDGSSTTVNAKNIMLATGSIPIELPALPFNGKTVVSSTEALSFTKVPEKLVVVGAGYIGLELGSVWMRLGSEVTVLEFSDKICGAMDTGISLQLKKSLEKQGMKFLLKSKVLGAQTSPDGKVTVPYQNLTEGKEESLKCDVVLVAAGRKPYSEGLGLEAVGVQKDDKGRVKVDSHFRTNFPNIYAVGDLIAGPMLAHKGEEEGVAVAEIIAGQAGHVNYDTVPSVIYTFPEVASVGLTEENLKEKGIAYKAGKFPFLANGRAKALGYTEGQVKVLADEKTDKLLGVHIFGPRASDLIHEAVVVMEFGGSAEDMARSFHAHPTLSEVVREAALDVDKRARQI